MFFGNNCSWIIILIVLLLCCNGNGFDDGFVPFRNDCRHRDGCGCC